jgi:hypothetical protein
MTQYYTLLSLQEKQSSARLNERNYGKTYFKADHTVGPSIAHPNASILVEHARVVEFRTSSVPKER